LCVCCASDEQVLRLVSLGVKLFFDMRVCVSVSLSFVHLFFQL
jgi:hypothetical protein